MNTIIAIVLKVLFPCGLSLSYIMIHSVMFQNGSTNVSNSGNGVPIPCRVLLFRLGGGWATTGSLFEWVCYEWKSKEVWGRKRKKKKE